ncbi:MAG: hypothetical protein QOC98_1208, partial [Frankiaceae bacterium]|nr:hypothetical protein [Frankiaceae bacterium]
ARGAGRGFACSGSQGAADVLNAGERVALLVQGEGVRETVVATVKGRLGR